VFYGEYATVNRGFTNLSANGAITAAGGQNFVNLSQADSEVWGFGVVQHIPAAAMEIYALYKNFDLDARDAAGAAISTEDIDIVYTGARSAERNPAPGARAADCRRSRRPPAPPWKGRRPA